MCTSIGKRSLSNTELPVRGMKPLEVADLVLYVWRSLVSGPAEPVRPLRPWSDQTFGYLWSKSCIQRVLVGPIIVKLRFFSKGRTNLALLPPLLCFDKHFFHVGRHQSFSILYTREAVSNSMSSRTLSQSRSFNGLA